MNVYVFVLYDLMTKAIVLAETTYPIYVCYNKDQKQFLASNLLLSDKHKTSFPDVSIRDTWFHDGRV